ncbi:unnamed protein product [Didymodactylos carnosus]|uniref:Uncharacterized protein n=1 Tax=Didymodactylos carnosus TaxID=1234261 RepID=A0A814X7Q3_9BILA|nr:unnamed protein product [Didymodactylos carnosus]CAF1212135.1 unnamed protein product [Didymodactylos carnosus]CAF3976102.1 unnamed protein product [Didymodactylos carnosus]CAF3990486.1 unnamed protein product [Didymodactylos carnosus]
MSLFHRRFGRKNLSSKKRLKSTDTSNAQSIIINQYNDQSSSYESIFSASVSSFDYQQPPVIDTRCLTLHNPKNRLSTSSTSSSSLLSRTFSQQQQQQFRSTPNDNDCISVSSETINNGKHSKRPKLNKNFIHEKENKSPFQTDKSLSNDMDKTSILSVEDLYKEALSNYKLELELSKTNGNKEQECQLTSFIGNTLAMLGQYDSAIEWFQTYLNLTKEILNKDEEAKALYYLGLMYHFKGKELLNVYGQLNNDIDILLRQSIKYYGYRNRNEKEVHIDYDNGTMPEKKQVDETS